MDDIVHLVFWLEIETSTVEILQNGAAHRGGGLGRKVESFVHDLFRRDSCLRCQAMVARKHEKQRVRGYAPAGQLSHVLFRSYESRIKSAPHQRLGERRGVIARQADFDARKLVSKDAVHLG